MNMTASPQTATVDLSEAGLHPGQLHTILASAKVPD